MNLPAYDEADDEDGGMIQSLGGWELMRYIKRYRRKIPSIVITQYHVTGDGSNITTLEEIDEKLKIEFSEYISRICVLRYIF